MQQKTNNYRLLDDGQTVEIYLTQGQITLIDVADLPRVIDGQGRWVAQWNRQGRCFYASRRGLAMSRLLMWAPAGTEVDHRNHDTLDNRRQNLRLATHAQNSSNRRLPSTSSSGYMGVSWNKAHRQWMSYIETNGRRRYLGYFDNKIEAAIMRDVFARLYHGEFACLNFPLASEPLAEAA